MVSPLTHCNQWVSLSAPPGVHLLEGVGSMVVAVFNCKCARPAGRSVVRCLGAFVGRRHRPFGSSASACSFARARYFRIHSFTLTVSTSVSPGIRFSNCPRPRSLAPHTCTAHGAWQARARLKQRALLTLTAPPFYSPLPRAVEAQLHGSSQLGGGALRRRGHGEHGGLRRQRV